MVVDKDQPPRPTIVISCKSAERKVEVIKFLAECDVETLELSFDVKVNFDPTIEVYGHHVSGEPPDASKDLPSEEIGHEEIAVFADATSASESMCGVRLRISTPAHSSSKSVDTRDFAETTLGGLISLAGDIYGLTVAHPITMPAATPTNTEDQDHVQIRGGHTHPLGASDQPWFTSFGKVVSYALSTSHEAKNSTRLAGNSESVPTNSDWALVELNESPITGSRFQSVGKVIDRDQFKITNNSDFNHVPVSIITGVSGVVKGSLSLTPSLLDYGQLQCDVMRIWLEKPLGKW